MFGRGSRGGCGSLESQAVSGSSDWTSRGDLHGVPCCWDALPQGADSGLIQRCDCGSGVDVGGPRRAQQQPRAEPKEGVSAHLRAEPWNHESPRVQRQRRSFARDRMAHRRCRAALWKQCVGRGTLRWMDVWKGGCWRRKRSRRLAANLQLGGGGRVWSVELHLQRGA